MSLYSLPFFKPIHQKQRQKVKYFTLQFFHLKPMRNINSFFITCITAISLLLISGLSFSQTPNSLDYWVTSWATSQMQPGNEAPAFENVTIRQVIHTSIGGDKIRLKFSNYSQDEAITFGEVTVALAGNDALTLPGSNRAVTFSGNPNITIPAGGSVYSDSVLIQLEPFTNVAVSMYMASPSAAATYHRQGLQTAYISTPGNFATDNDFSIAEESQRIFFLNGLEVSTSVNVKSVIAFGDSITNGTGSTVNTNRRWPDFLARSLEGKAGVINQSISGNRLLNDFVGMSGIARFEKNVLSWPNITHVIVLIGINDIGYSRYPESVFEPGVDASDVSSDKLIAGYRALIKQARAKDIQVIGATLLPFRGSGHFTETGEAKRQAINTWIRESGEFDGIIDFDSALRDPAEPSRMKTQYQKDWLHPNDDGYKAMTSAISHELFD